jgi:hypothetical protein
VAIASGIAAAGLVCKEAQRTIAQPTKWIDTIQAKVCLQNTIAICPLKRNDGKEPAVGSAPSSFITIPHRRRRTWLHDRASIVSKKYTMQSTRLYTTTNGVAIDKSACTC